MSEDEKTILIFRANSYDNVISLSSDHMLSDQMTVQPKGRRPYVQWEVGSKCDNVLQTKMRVPKETGRL